MSSTTAIMMPNNRGHLIGKITEEPIKTFDVEGEKFYEGKIEVQRLSETVDILPFTISEKLLTAYQLKLAKGNTLSLGGELRSYNRLVNGKSKLILSFFVKEILSKNDLKEDNSNNLKLVGYICKEPNYRVTPFNREICDILVAVNRPFFNKSDYIPCIVWGRNAYYVRNLKVGTKIKIEGRIQSRIYRKEIDEGIFEERTAYEVSGQKIKVEEKENESGNSNELGA